MNNYRSYPTNSSASTQPARTLPTAHLGVVDDASNNNSNHHRSPSPYWTHIPRNSTSPSTLNTVHKLAQPSALSLVSPTAYAAYVGMTTPHRTAPHALHCHHPHTPAHCKPRRMTQWTPHAPAPGHPLRHGLDGTALGHLASPRPQQPTPPRLPPAMDPTIQCPLTTLPDPPSPAACAHKPPYKCTSHPSTPTDTLPTHPTTTTAYPSPTTFNIQYHHQAH